MGALKVPALFLIVFNDKTGFTKFVKLALKMTLDSTAEWIEVDQCILVNLAKRFLFLVSTTARQAKAGRVNERQLRSVHFGDRVTLCRDA